MKCLLDSLHRLTNFFSVQPSNNVELHNALGINVASLNMFSAIKQLPMWSNLFLIKTLLLKVRGKRKKYESF